MLVEKDRDTRLYVVSEGKSRSLARRAPAGAAKPATAVRVIGNQPQTSILCGWPMPESYADM